MSKDELDALNESADQKYEKLSRDTIDPTPGLFIDDKLNPNEQNLQNKQITFLIFQLRYNSSLMKMSLKNYKTNNNSTNSTRSYFKCCSKYLTPKQENSFKKFMIFIAW